MSNTEAGKKVVRDLIQTVWNGGQLDALPHFWTVDCVNHAMSGSDNRGLDALRIYHEQFMTAFAAFAEVHTHIEQQIAEADRVVTYTIARGRHTGPFFGIAPTGKSVSLASIRIDRIKNDRIAEHWSVGDMAGLMQQLQA